MAKVKVQMPDEFLNQIAGMGNAVDAALPKALEAGGKVVLDRMKSNLRAAVGHGTKYKSRSTGKLLAALGVSPAKLNRDGDFDVKIGFSESRDVSNAMLANLIEYGKHGQPARPFLKQTKSSSRKPCIEAMKEALKEELGLE